MRAYLTRGAGLLWLAVTLAATLQPLHQVTPVPFWSFFRETMSGVDYAQNVVLFLPLGWIAHRGRWRWWQAVRAGALLSGGIEFAQLWIPGRTTQATDIICNTLGAVVGWWMASSARRPRVRLGAGFVVLGGFLALHALNTRWPDRVAHGGGIGAWSRATRESCPAEVRDGTACFLLPNESEAGSRYIRVVGPDDKTYARVQSFATGRVMTRRDCVLLLFEQTAATPLRLRPPLVNACGVADSAERVIALRVNPRLEHERPGSWTATRAGAWMWPVWPFASYQPQRQVSVAAVTFVVLAALAIGSAWWIIPSGYLATLALAALVAGLRAPGWWELGAAAAGWLIAALAVRLDRWWRGDTPSSPASTTLV